MSRVRMWSKATSRRCFQPLNDIPTWLHLHSLLLLEFLESGPHPSVAMVEGVDLPFRGAVQEHGVALRVMLHHARMQVPDRLTLRRSKRTHIHVLPEEAVQALCTPASCPITAGRH